MTCIHLTRDHDPEYVLLTKERTSFEHEREIIGKTNYRYPPKQSYKSLKEEQIAMKLFVSYNPFPKKFRDTPYYDFVKDIYENITNEDTLKEIGKKINELFEMRGMIICFYWITTLTPIAKHAFTMAYAHATMWKAWDGIGQWKY